MITRFNKMVFLLVILICSASVMAQRANNDIQVDIFFDKNTPVNISSASSNALLNVSIFELGRVNEIESYLSEGIQNDSMAMQKLAKSRITPKVKKLLGEAWRAHIFAADVGITHVPAIVINRQYVYYGKNINKALELWRQYAN